MDNFDVEQIKFKDSKKQRAVYKVTSPDGNSYSLKKVFYGVGELLFIYSAVQWWHEKGINIPIFIPTAKGGRFVNYEKMLFIMTPWIEGHKLDYDCTEDFVLSGENLAYMHKVGSNFRPIEGSSLKSSSSNPAKSITKRTKLLVSNYNQSLGLEDDFSILFREDFESIFKLSELAYKISAKIDVSNLTYSLCHMDYVNKNIIFDGNNKIWVIDFDNCRQTFIGNDICHGLRRYLKRSSTLWNFDLFKIWIETYNKVLPITRDDLLFIFMNLVFPQRIWKVSRDYYRNYRKCNKNTFLKLLQYNLSSLPKKLEFAKLFESNLDTLINEFTYAPKFFIDFET